MSIPNRTRARAPKPQNASPKRKFKLKEMLIRMRTKGKKVQPKRKLNKKTIRMLFKNGLIANPEKGPILGTNPEGTRKIALKVAEDRHFYANQANAYQFQNIKSGEAVIKNRKRVIKATGIPLSKLEQAERSARYEALRRTSNVTPAEYEEIVRKNMNKVFKGVPKTKNTKIINEYT